MDGDSSEYDPESEQEGSSDYSDDENGVRVNDTCRGTHDEDVKYSKATLPRLTFQSFVKLCDCDAAALYADGGILSRCEVSFSSLQKATEKTTVRQTLQVDGWTVNLPYIPSFAGVDTVNAAVQLLLEDLHWKPNMCSRSNVVFNNKTLSLQLPVLRQGHHQILQFSVTVTWPIVKDTEWNGIMEQVRTNRGLSAQTSRKTIIRDALLRGDLAAAVTNQIKVSP
jgi:hypothetical protein